MSETINDILKIHAGALPDWSHAQLIQLLHEWADRFDSEFELKVETPAFRIEKIRRGALGAYRYGRNSFGLLHEISFNPNFLDRPIAFLLETLLHEILHEWQALHGSPSSGNYHNREFRKKAQDLGLLIGQRGRSEGVIPESSFVDILERHDIDTSVFFVPREPKLWLKLSRGRSKMKKYSCACTNLRCAVLLEAKCLKCEQLFLPSEPNW